MGQKKLIEELYFCAAKCIECYHACQAEEHNEMLEQCMKLDQECADICELTASLLERDSPNTNKFLLLCAEICGLCAEECEKHELRHCRSCAAECRKCIIECKSAVVIA